MKIELHEIPVRELFEGYRDSAEEGVVGYGGRLDIRPKYQREFVYDTEQRDAVIATVRKNFPLNVMYWVKTDDGNFELLDGQQRTISICRYVNGDYSIDDFYFHNLTDNQQKQILDYKLMIYFCEGDKDEKLDWFQTINIAGEKLYNQEILNALFTGPWLTDAKRYFSKTGCVAYQMANQYMTGKPIRQDYLETVLKWINNGNPKEYMSRYQFKPNANDLWMYFVNVINWVKILFPVYRSEMKGIPWGELYNKYNGNSDYDATELENKISILIQDEDLQSTKGIYEYVLSGDIKHLHFRAFLKRDKRVAYERQNGVCPHCHNHYEFEEMEADHIIPWSRGGKTILENCQMLCRECNRRKSDN